MAENRALLTTIKAALNIYDVAEPGRVLIIDTSHWTGVVDWDMAWAANVRGAIIKMLDGKAKVKFAEENYKGAKDRGLLVGGYQWLYKSSNVSAGAQAREYLAYLKDHPCEIRPAIDFEWTKYNGAQANPNKDDLYGHVIPFEEGYEKKPMIYTAPGYWDDPANQSKKGLKESMWAEYPLWAAEYRTKNGAFIPFGPWAACKLLQFTGNGQGSLYGFPKTGEKEADLNYWPGTLPELYAWCDVGQTPPVEPPDTQNKVARRDEVERMQVLVNKLLNDRLDALK